MEYIYPAQFYEEEDGRYSVIFPDFGGATYGNNLEDAFVMARDYLGGVISDMIKCNEKLPEASDVSAIRADEYPNGFVMSVTVHVDGMQLFENHRYVCGIKKRQNS